MSNFTEGNYKSFKANADLSAKQYYIVKLDTDGVGIVLASAASDFVLGTLNSKPTSGMTGDVSLRSAAGTHKVVLGGTVSAVGGKLVADSAGKAVVSTNAGDHMIGYALQTGSAGDIIEYMPSADRV